MPDLPGWWTIAWQALAGVALSLPPAIALGGPLGVLLHQLQRAPASPLAQALRALCSPPCVILLLALVPLLDRRPLALALAAIPYFARLVATSLQVVPRGLVDAAVAMGASPLQIATRVLLPEAREALVRAATLLAASLLACQTIAQLGVGDPVRLALALAILAAQVQLMQLAGARLARRLQRDPAGAIGYGQDPST